MVKRAYVLLLALLLLLTGCSAAELAAEKTEEALPTTSVVSSTAPSAEAEEPSAQPSKEAADPNAPVDIVTADEGKEIRQEQPMVKDSGMPEVYQEYAQQMEEACTDFGEDLSEKIYVYPEYTLQCILWPAADAVMYSENGRTKLSVVASQVPTEAVRWIDDHYFYTIHDTDTHLRVFAFYHDFGSDDGYYARIGYPVYMSQTLCYNDFDDIKVGMKDDAIRQIEPKIMHLYLDDVYMAPYYSIHLLSDGILMYTYEKQGEEFYISDIYFSEDYVLTNLYSIYGEEVEVCYQIDPLDYVVNSPPEELNP